MVRNGRAEPRMITTGAGPIEVEAPRVNDRRVDERPGAVAVPQLDPGAVVPQEPEGVRGVAVDVPARDELGGLRPGAGRVLRLRRRAVARR